MQKQDKKLIVMKFGGSSLAAPERMREAVHVVREEQTRYGDVAVVVSAIGGVTDALLALAGRAARGEENLRSLSDIRKVHKVFMRELAEPKRLETALKDTDAMFEELDQVLRDAARGSDASQKTNDAVASFGERFSARIFTEALKANGLGAAYLDARDLVVTDDRFGDASVLIEETYRNLRSVREKNAGILVITGFIGRTRDGHTTTLGRSGSDYTAALVAAALDAGALYFYKDVEGLMSADPKKIADARPLSEVSYEEAMEMSHFGAKVLHPRTMWPAIEKKIPIAVKDARNPTAEGTRIVYVLADESGPVRAVSTIEQAALINVVGGGMIGVPGFAGRLFGALARASVNIILISQASSEHSICLAIREADAERATIAVEEEFAAEIKQQAIRSVEAVTGLVIMAVIGERMRGTPGISGRLFGTLGRHGVNVMAIAQGSSERNISFVVSSGDERRVLAAAHEAFFKRPKEAHIFLAGTGVIGSELLVQIKAQSKTLRERQGVDISLGGIVNAEHMTLSDERVDEKPDLRVFVNAMIGKKLPGTVFVDCTASEEVSAFYPEILRAGISVVTPNKKANSGPYAFYRAVREAAQEGHSRFLYETNVGAALPIIGTLRDLVATGDEIVKIEGIFSGTLSYIFNSFTAGRRFSDIVREAKARGYTEPDPRDDLSGTDVARKLLILAREMGMEAEFSDVRIENLVPSVLRSGINPEDFLEKLSQHDADFEKKRAQAEENGKRLFAVGAVERGSMRVSLEALPRDHPFSSLSGSDNIIAFTTRRYHDRPLVVRGPGAGASVTAGGVFADILRALEH